MKRKYLLLVAASALVITPALAMDGKPRFAPWGVDLTAIDSGVKPGDDFFDYVNGAWAKRTETVNQGQRMLADVIPLGGGMPINVGEETIGGVGLSGAPGGQEQEEACATAGIAKVADQLK